MIGPVLGTWCDGAFRSGDWHQARALAARAAAAVDSVGTSWTSSYVWFAQGRLALAEGDGEAGATALAAAVQAAEVAGNLYALRACQALLAERDLLAEQSGAARERLAPLLDPPHERTVSSTGVLPLLVWVYRDFGDLDHAERLAALAVALATSQEQRIGLVDALRAAAMVAVRKGRRADAVAALEEAVALAHALPYPYGEAKALYVYGLLHLESGEPQPAGERLDAARAICARLGERLYAEHIERVLTAEQRGEYSPAKARRQRALPQPQPRR